MRVSARTNDSGFVADRSGIKVFLNGEQIFDCILADEEAGIVVLRERDAAGKLIVDGDHLREVERSGRVVIRR
jgi:hypothetical protein